jgi:hypothetical protein
LRSDRLTLLPDQLKPDHAQKPTPKGAFWLSLIFKILSKNQTENGAFEIIDNSRLSTEIIAPFSQHNPCAFSDQK